MFLLYCKSNEGELLGDIYKYRTLGSDLTNLSVGIIWDLPLGQWCGDS